MVMSKEELVELYQKNQDKFWEELQKHCSENNIDLKTYIEKEFLSRSQSQNTQSRRRR